MTQHKTGHTQKTTLILSTPVQWAAVSSTGPLFYAAAMSTSPVPLLSSCRLTSESHLAPGGKIEIAEGRAQFFCDDNTWPPESAMRKWMDEFNRIGVSMGLVFDIIPLIPSMLSDLNFEEVERVDKIVPLGPWPKDKGLKQIGLFFRLQFLEMALEAYTMALFTRNGWSQEETHVLLAQVRNEIKGGKMHLYTHWYDPTPSPTFKMEKMVLTSDDVARMLLRPSRRRNAGIMRMI
jgi:hypothetical protein